MRLPRSYALGLDLCAWYLYHDVERPQDRSKLIISFFLALFRAGLTRAACLFALSHCNDSFDRTATLSSFIYHFPTGK